MAALVLFAAAEGLLRVAYFIRNSTVASIPLPYVVGQDYGPLPPWLDALRLLEPDKALTWRNRPNLRRTYIDVFSPVRTEDERRSLLRQFLPALPASLRGNPVWEISLNSEGSRDVEFPTRKTSSAFRVICLGDSWTFGANVGQGEAYPQRLKTLLTRTFPRAQFEVFNLGVLGYSSFQGLELLKRRAIDLNPDLVVIGFGMNDASVAGYRDKDMPSYKETWTWVRRIGHVAERSEFYRLLRYLALRLKHESKTMGQHLQAKAESDGKADEKVEYAKLEAWTRVSPRDYENNLLEMIALARRHQAGVLLLYNELWEDSPYRAVLERVARAERVPLVDSSALIAKARRLLEEELERRLDLRPAGAFRASATEGVEVVFRVYLGDRPVPKAVSIVGAHPQLGNLVPNRVAMRDDGRSGDQRAGDRVWSYTITFPPGTRVFCVYTNSGDEGRWEGLDVPEIRSFRVDVGNEKGRVYRPIESFGKIPMQADSWHTDAAGYDLMAGALLEKLKQDERVRRYLERVPTSMTNLDGRKQGG